MNTTQIDTVAATASLQHLAGHTSGPLQPYVMPPRDTYSEWNGCANHAYVPTARQETVIAAVRSALAAKLYYTDEVLAHCVKVLGVTSEQALVGAKHVQGGDVGMDCYYARKYIQAQAEYAQQRAAVEQMQLVPGLNLGTLVFPDFKKSTGVTVEAAEPDGMCFRLSGKRGAYGVRTTLSALSIRDGIDRAASKGYRKDNCAALWPAA